MIASKISQWDLSGKRVLVRADLNLPIVHDSIQSDIRLTAFLPTLKLLLDKGAQVILTTHMGNAEALRHNPISTQKLIPFLKPYCPIITFCSDILHAQQETNASVIMLENLRLFPGETSQDISFAQSLASLGTYYVNDAFALLHRSDTSITIVPTLFHQNNRSCGLLIERELSTLANVRNNPVHPFICLIGGNKPTTKIPYIQNLQKADAIIILPLISNTYMYCKNEKIGLSEIELSIVPSCLKQLAGNNLNIYTPIDYLVKDQSLIHSFRIANQASITSQDTIITIGPKTLENIEKILQRAKTIFINGFSGIETYPETMHAASELLTFCTQTNAFTIISGGNTTALAQQHNLLAKFNFFSTGGGATLAYLSGSLLPGLVCL